MTTPTIDRPEHVTDAHYRQLRSNFKRELSSLGYFDYLTQLRLFTSTSAQKHRAHFRTVAREILAPIGKRKAHAISDEEFAKWQAAMLQRLAKIVDKNNI